MNWDAVGAIGEVVGAAAVVATLIYLSVQIRANTKVSRVESRRTSTRQSSDYATIIANSTETASIFRRGLEDMNSLDPDERIRFIFLFSMLISQTQSSFEDAELGIVDWESFESGATPAFRMLTTPGGTQFWQKHNIGYAAAFRSRINELLVDQG